MRTSLNEIEKIEEQLLKNPEGQDKLLFEARLIIDPALRDKVLWQQHTYRLVKQYGRTQLKAELAAIHNQLFTKVEHQSFAQKIRRFFC